MLLIVELNKELGVTGNISLALREWRMGSKIVIEWGQSILALLGRHKFPLSNGLGSHNAK